jgi:hypothetical protein
MEVMNSSRYYWQTSGKEFQNEFRELYIIQNIVKKWAPLFITACGIFGNTISLFITTKNEYRHISTGCYMSALSVIDNIYLVNIILYTYFINHGLGAKLKHIEIAGK